MTISLPIWMFARGAIVLALALLATRLLRRAPASLRHTLVAATFAALLALPAITAIVPAWHAGTIADAPRSAIAPAALPAAEPGAAVTAPPVLAPPGSGPASIPLGAIAGACWLAGIALGALRIAIGAQRARRIAVRGEPVAGKEAYVVAAWRLLGGRRAAPRVVASDEIEAPIVVGAFAPVVVVPRSSIGWGAERWRVVLLHELAHVRRRDGISNLVAQLACAVHWPDPLAWIAARRLRAECELAADDAVLRGGARASTYAEHLLAIATGATHSAPAAALTMAGQSRFEARVVALFDDRRVRSPIGARRTIAVTGAVAAVAAVAACVSPEAAPAQRTPGGTDVIATKDPALQAAAGAELDRAMAARHAAGAIAIVLDAKTGAALAIATRGDGDARAARPPGSTMKPFTIAAALESGVVDSSAHVDCENGSRMYGDKKLMDAAPHGVLDLGGVLAVSSNVCTAKIAEPLGDRLGEALRRYHFAAPGHIDTRSLEGASISAGEGIRASALEVAAAYTAFADGGAYHAPDGSSGDGGERVMSTETARTVMAMLDRVVDDVDGTGRAARIAGVRVAGKTGTAQTSVAGQYYASFVGIVPANAPRLVVLVGFDGVTGAGGEVAAPVFARIATLALAR
jgi:beta-lactamase regulating signal transducer with metallopeptidase domain